jgi:hypothetical protein
MKVPLRIKLGVAALIFVAGVGTAVVAMPEPAPKKIAVEQTSTVSPEPVVASESTEVAAETPAPVQTPVASPAPVPEQPKYGKSLDGFGSYKVFDAEWLLDQVGITQEDRQYVHEIIDHYSNWTYKNDNPTVNLCMVQPAIKMQRWGDDYLDNPVTQMKFCNAYVTGRYGNWQAAKEYFASHLNF